MPHTKGRPKEIWTGLLPPGVEAKGPQDDRICWHVLTPYGSVDKLREDLLAIGEQELAQAKPIPEWPAELQAEFWGTLTKYVTGWSNYLQADGTPVAFTVDEFLGVDVSHIEELMTCLPLPGRQVATA